MIHFLTCVNQLEILEVIHSCFCETQQGSHFCESLQVNHFLTFEVTHFLTCVNQLVTLGAIHSCFCGNQLGSHFYGIPLEIQICVILQETHSYSGGTQRGRHSYWSQQNRSGVNQPGMGFCVNQLVMGSGEILQERRFCCGATQRWERRFGWIRQDCAARHPSPRPPGPGRCPRGLRVQTPRHCPGSRPGCPENPDHWPESPDWLVLLQDPEIHCDCSVDYRFLQ